MEFIQSYGNYESFETIQPGKEWNANSYSNNLYKITTESGECLGTFLPKDGTLIKISGTTDLTPSSLSEYKTGQSGCNISQYSGMYGISSPIANIELIKNNSPKDVYIYQITPDGKRVEPPALLKPSNSLTVKNITTNTLFQIADLYGSCMGVFLPKIDKMHLVTDLSILAPSSSSDYKTGMQGCGINQYSGMYGTSKPISGVLLKNDTKNIITVHLINDVGEIDNVGVRLKPGEEWNTSTKTNYIYQIKNEAGQCLGTFVPEEGKIENISNITALSSTNLSDFILGKDGCTANQYSGMYGNKQEVSGKLIINDTNQPIRIYHIDETGQERFGNKLNENLNNLNKVDNSDNQLYNVGNNLEGFDTILPGEVWSGETLTNNLYKIMTEGGECLGTFLPKEGMIEKVSAITGLPEDSNGDQTGTKGDKNNDDNIIKNGNINITGNNQVIEGETSNSTLYIILLIIVVVLVGFFYFNKNKIGGNNNINVNEILEYN